VRSLRALGVALLGVVLVGADPPSAEPLGTPTTPGAASRPFRGECAGADCFVSAHGFRPIHPLPVSHPLKDVHVLPGGDVLVVGGSGLLLRIDRSGPEPTLHRVPVPGTQTIKDVFDAIDPPGPGRTPTEEEFPGSQHTLMGFDAVVARDHSRVFIAQGADRVARWDGDAWTWIDNTSLAGADALHLDRDGTLWSWGGIAVFGTSAPKLLRPGASRFVDGPTWSGKQSGRAMDRQGDAVWAAGYEGLFAKSVGGAPFVAQPRPEGSADGSDLSSLWLQEDGDDGLVADLLRAWRKTGDAWAPVTGIDGLIADVHGEADAGWLVGEWPTRVVGTEATRVPIDGWVLEDDSILRLGDSRINAVHGRAADDVWMVGAAGLILHWDGTALRQLAVRHSEQEIVGLVWEDEDRWLAASSDGRLIQGSLRAGVTGSSAAPLDGADSLQRLASGEVLLHELCDELMVRRPDGTWTALPELEEGCVKDVAGRSSTDLWGVGTRDFEDGKVLRLRGKRWTEVRSGTDKELRAVAVGADGTVWIGGDGVLLKAPGGKNLAVVATHEYDEYRAILPMGPDEA